MSILSRLRALFGGGDKEEKNVSMPKTEEKAKTNVKVTSSKKKLQDDIVSGTKTSESISTVKSGSKDIPSQKDKKSSVGKAKVVEPKKSDKKETSAPKVTEKPKKEEVTIPELAEEANEIAQERVDEVAEKEAKEEEAGSNLIDKSEDNINGEESKEEVTIPELAEEAAEIAQKRINEVAEKEAEEEEAGSDLIDDEENASEDDESEEVEIEDENTDKNKKRDNMTLLTDKELINSESLDKDFTAAFIDAGIETLKNCFQCGTCGGSCPSGRRTPYKVRQLVRKCLLGLKEDVISDDALWMCTTCYTCQERCPRSVIIVEIVKKARNIAAHAGYMAKPHRMTGLFVITTGHGVPINPVTKELRARVGLGELPPTTHMYPEALEEVQKICKITGFDELIGYDEATGELKPE